jgi:hypothetical protein
VDEAEYCETWQIFFTKNFSVSIWNNLRQHDTRMCMREGTRKREKKWRYLNDNKCFTSIALFSLIFKSIKERHFFSRSHTVLWTHKDTSIAIRKRSEMFKKICSCSFMLWAHRNMCFVVLHISITHKHELQHKRQTERTNICIYSFIWWSLNEDQMHSIDWLCHLDETKKIELTHTLGTFDIYWSFVDFWWIACSLGVCNESNIFTFYFDEFVDQLDHWVLKLHFTSCTFMLLFYWHEINISMMKINV